MIIYNILVPHHKERERERQKATKTEYEVISNEE